MKEKLQVANRKTVGSTHIAICPIYGCETKEKVKPLKFGLFGFSKHPRCSYHQGPLVYIEVLTEQFFNACSSCLFDRNSLPPTELLKQIAQKDPSYVSAFIDAWIYCGSTGRDGQVISAYVDNLSRGYISLLSRKEQKAVHQENPKNRHQMLASGFNKIILDYTQFLIYLRRKSDELLPSPQLIPYSPTIKNIVKHWVDNHLLELKTAKPTSNISEKKTLYDEVLSIGTALHLLGMSNSILNKMITPYELFSGYRDFLQVGSTQELLLRDILNLKTKYDSERSKEGQLNEILLIKDEKDNISNLDKDNFIVIKDKNDEKQVEERYMIFKSEVLRHIMEIIPLIDVTKEQEEVIINKAEEITDQVIQKAKTNDIIIRKDVKYLNNAGAMLFSIIISTQNMPKISISIISELLGVNRKGISKSFNNWYKDLIKISDFNFQYVQLAHSRKVLSLYFYIDLIKRNLGIIELISDLDKVSVKSKITEIIELFKSKKNIEFISLLRKDELEVYENMLANHPKIFSKLFQDLILLVKFIIISNKSHLIIGADFSIKYFIKFLKSQDITLCLKKGGLYKVVAEIFKNIREHHPEDSPNLMKSEENSLSDDRIKWHTHREIVGTRIKFFLMKYIYNGKYLYNEREFPICLDCLEEGFDGNLYSPRIRSKEFHHEDSRLEAYESRSLYSFFIKDRGNPYFLIDLMRKMENESVVLKCGSHHSIISSLYFNYFKKLISWENIPAKFPYKDIFELPPPIINILIIICTEKCDYPEKDKNTDNYSKYGVRGQIIYFLKKRDIIDQIYNGSCPICKEFNTKDHLPAFEFHHIDEISNNKRIIPNLYNSSCSEIANEIEKEKGAFICRNCHFTIHDNIHRIDKIFENDITRRRAYKDYEICVKNYKKKFFTSATKIKDPLNANYKKYKALYVYLDAIFQISVEKGSVSIKDLRNRLGKNISNIYHFFQKRKDLLEKFGTIVREDSIKYYMNKEGKNFMELIYYFRDYYKNVEINQ